MEIATIIMAIGAVALIIFGLKKAYNAFYEYIMIAVGVVIVILSIIFAANGVWLGLLGIPFGLSLAGSSLRSIRNNSRRSSHLSSSSSSSSSPSPEHPVRMRTLRRPTSDLEYEIVREIERRLPSCTPSTGITATIYGDTVNIDGTIFLWHSSDSNAIAPAISNGVQAAINSCGAECGITSLSISTSSLTIRAADLES